MIGFLSGVVKLIENDAVVVLVGGGVGYRALMPVPDLARLAIGDVIDVHVHTHVREDAIVLYAFSTRDGLALFEKLIGVSGVGPKTALALLSGLDGVDVVRAIAEKDEARLTKIPGVGKKTAARIVLELADALAKSLATGSLTPRAAGRGGAMDDLRSALANLGYKGPQIDRAVQKVKPLVEDGGQLSDLVREALRHVQ